MDAGPAPAPASATPSPLGDNVLVPRRPIVDDARFDVTAMVDLVFMMNIYFLVVWITAALAEIDLPAARHCTAAASDNSVVVTMTDNPGQTPSVYLGDAQPGGELSGSKVEEAIAAAAEAGQREGKVTVLIKAEKGVRLKDVARIARAATSVKGMKLNLAVMEKD